VGVMALASVLLAASGIRARHRDADSIYRDGQGLLDAGDAEAAIGAFRRAQGLAPLSNTAIHSTYFEAIALYRDERWEEAGAVFQRLVDRYPEAHAAAESLYHVGLCASAAGERERARVAFEQTQRRFPGTYWAGVASDRLAELGAFQ
jgi:TolA-binding protein